MEEKCLSKEALQLLVGSIGLNEFVDGEEIKFMALNLSF